MKALILGAGTIAKVHCSVLASHNVTVSGIYNIRLGSAQVLASQVGAQAYEDLDTALGSDFDFAVICTPSGTHAKLAIRVMESGRDVVVEKPLALNNEDCDAIVKTAARTGRLCAPISQLRFSSTYQAVKACLARRELGTAVMASLSMKYWRTGAYYTDTWKGTRDMDGGHLMNQGIHGIDIMCGLLGKPAVVSGAVATRYHPIEAEDTAVAHFIFPGGMLGTLDSSTAIGQSKPRRLELSGSNGMIVMEEDRIVLAQNVSLAPEPPGQYRGNRDPGDIGLELHSRSYRNILAAMVGKEPLQYTAAEAADAVAVIRAIYQSSETGRHIRL